jgi:hypothetical protein
MTAAEEVQSIDAEIDAVRRELYRRIGFLPNTAGEFHRAWLRHPDLHARHKALYVRRGEAQERVWEAEAKADAAAKRKARAEARRKPLFARCPTCGCHTLEAAA